MCGRHILFLMAVTCVRDVQVIVMLMGNIA